MIIEQIVGHIDSIHIGDRRKVRILTDRYDLAKPHQKLKTEEGEVFALSLERGEFLERGSVIYEDSDRVVYIDLLEEECLVIEPENNLQWARAAFNIGNMHQAAYIDGDRILVAYDPVLEKVIAKIHVPYRRQVCLLKGVKAAVSQEGGHEHHHGHQGSDDHSYDGGDGHHGHHHHESGR